MSGQWEEAANAYTAAIGFAPRAHKLLTNRALCNQKLERWSEVERDAREARGLHETDVKAHYLLGKVIWLDDDYDHGVDVCCIFEDY